MMHNHVNLDSLDAEVQHFNRLYDTNSNISDKYLSVREFKDKYNLSIDENKTVSVLHWNVRSLLPKLDQVTSELNEMSFDWDIISLCETWINANTRDLAILNNYVSFHIHRDTHSPGGGNSIFARSCLNPKVLPRFQVVLPFFECIGIEFSKYSKKFMVCEIYRPPRSNSSDFLDQLEILFNNLQTTQYDEIFICGDHNLNLLDVETNNSVS